MQVIDDIGQEVSASPAAVKFIHRAHGGRVYVWPRPIGSAVARLEVAREPPDDRPFSEVALHGVRIAIADDLVPPPEKPILGLRLRWFPRRRVIAFWAIRRNFWDELLWRIVSMGP